MLLILRVCSLVEHFIVRNELTAEITEQTEMLLFHIK